MIKARSGTTMIFGLSAKNLALLQQGQPIAVDLKDLGFSEGKVLILYGKDEMDIVRELEASGIRLPYNFEGAI